MTGRELVEVPRNPVKESDNTHALWYEEASKQTLATLPEFVRRLATRYDHDYGTICHACAAAAVGAAHAVNRGPTGGITGFQGGAVMWEFIGHWQHYKGPMRLMRYEELLYPQNVRPMLELSKETFEWLQLEARKHLRERGRANPDVVKHWERLAAGRVPEGFYLEEKKT
jgi:hypothetical protein